MPIVPGHDWVITRFNATLLTTILSYLLQKRCHALTFLSVAGTKIC